MNAYDGPRQRGVGGGRSRLLCREGLGRNLAAATADAAKSQPLLVYLVAVAAVVIVLLGGYWIKAHYDYKTEMGKQAVLFEAIRQGNRR